MTWQTKLWLFKLECLADIYSKVTKKMRMSLQGKQMATVVASDKIWALKWILESFIYRCEFNSFLILEDCSEKIIFINVIYCWYFVANFINIWKLYLTQFFFFKWSMCTAETKPNQTKPVPGDGYLAKQWSDSLDIAPILKCLGSLSAAILVSC